MRCLNSGKYISYKRRFIGGTIAELKVYEALEKLGKNFYIFHSVQWLKKTKKWAATWKENDF